MKIAWFTPFAAGTRIAEYSALVGAAFAALGHQPLIMRIDELDRPGQPFDGEVIPWRFWLHLYDADAVFYNVGDDFREFAPAYDLMRRKPGIAIFHDATLSGYFAAHGAASGLPAGAVSQSSSIARMAAEAIAAVTADESVAALLSASCPGPVLRLDAPGDAAVAAAYAERLLALAFGVAAVAPVVGASRQFSDHLADMGLVGGDPLIGRIARAAQSLFPDTLAGSAQPDPL